MRMFPIFLAVICLAEFTDANADDWPQWMGPRRDSVWRETGIVKRFPAEGLPIKWKTPVELGYSGPAVAGGRVFVMDYLPNSGDFVNSPTGRTRLEGKERVLCFDARTGKLLWKHEYDCDYYVSYPAGPRCTPTVDSGRVYALGAEGNLTCLDARRGKVIWSKELKKEYQIDAPLWGFTAHPLIDGDRLFCMVGGEGSVAVAFDKNSGKEVWRSLSASDAGYCPPTMIQHAGTRQLVIWHPETINGLNPRTGQVYWSLPLKPSYQMSCTAPRKLGNYIFASGIGRVGALMRLDGSQPGAEFEWHGEAKSAVYCCNSTPFLESGMIYGCDCHSGALIGAQLKDGKRLWETSEPTTGARRASHGTAFIVKHQDRFFLFNEKGDLILARLTPEKYEELDRFHVLEPTNEAFGREVVWSHPAFAQKCVFARNDKQLVCVDLSASR